MQASSWHHWGGNEETTWEIWAEFSFIRIKASALFAWKHEPLQILPKWSWTPCNSMESSCICDALGLPPCFPYAPKPCSACVPQTVEGRFFCIWPHGEDIFIVDDRGRLSGKSIVEFSGKPAARITLDRCSEGSVLLTTFPWTKPVRWWRGTSREAG